MSREKILSVSIHDCRVDAFRAGGPGGQNKNKVSSAIRITHELSGAVGTATEMRDQIQNKKAAFLRMVKSALFQTWLNAQIDKILKRKPSIDEVVAEQMKPENLKIEYGHIMLN